jgi:hypothetical protein
MGENLDNNKNSTETKIFGTQWNNSGKKKPL